MPRVWKEVLVPGRFRTREGRWFRYDPRDIRQAHRNCVKMLSRGVSIPAVWEHQDVEAGDPAAWKARYAKYTFGHVTAATINGRGALELEHEVPDPKDVEQLAKTRFCSPKMYRGYSDSRGGEYRGPTVAHVAATPTPVLTTQRPWPFELSRGKAFYLSYSPEGPDVGEKADDDKGKKDGEDKGGKGKGEGDAAQLNDLIEALREVGMTIPDEVVDLSGLIIAVKASGGAGKGDEDLELDDEDGGQTSGATTGGAGAPMLMSDPRYQGYAKNERKELGRRVNKLFSTGRVDRPTAVKLLGQVKAQELSFTRGGDLAPTRLVMRIEALEELPKGAVWSKDGKGRGKADELSVTEVEPPDRLTGGDPKKALAEATEFLCAGLPAPKK